MVIKRYNYPSFPGFADVRPFRERPDLKVGQEAPDFTGNVLETGSITLSQLRDLAHVVLEFGSITSPQFCAGVPELEALRAEFEPKGFRFFVVYTRECHPAENYPQHSSYEDKVECASVCRELERVTTPIIVDTLEGDIHQAYGSLPNMCYVVDKRGRIYYRSQWAAHDELKEILNDLVHMAAEVQRRGSELPDGRVFYYERLRVHNTDQEARQRIFDRAGQRAHQEWADVFARRR